MTWSAVSFRNGGEVGKVKPRSRVRSLRLPGPERRWTEFLFRGQTVCAAKRRRCGEPLVVGSSTEERGICATELLRGEQFCLSILPLENGCSVM